MRINAPYCKLIHLASFKNSGYAPLDHGTGWSNENKYKLKHIMDLYRRYNYTCPITLEVIETDYLKSDNYKNSRDVLCSLL